MWVSVQAECVCVGIHTHAKRWKYSPKYTKVCVRVNVTALSLDVLNSGLLTLLHQSNMKLLLF